MPMTADMQRRVVANREKARDAFAQKKIQIDAMLGRIKAHSNNHFDVPHDHVNWADVGSLSFCIGQLNRITDHLFDEGENAE